MQGFAADLAGRSALDELTLRSVQFIVYQDFLIVRRMACPNVALTGSISGKNGISGRETPASYRSVIQWLWIAVIDIAESIQRFLTSCHTDITRNPSGGAGPKMDVWT